MFNCRIQFCHALASTGWNTRVLFSIAIAGSVTARANANVEHTIENSKGTAIKLIVRGDDAYQWYEEMDLGFSVIRIPKRYEYALRGKDGSLMPSGLLAGAVGPAEHGLATGVGPSPEFLRSKQDAGPLSSRSPPSPHPITIRQPKGIEIQVHLKGGRTYNWYVDSNGYAIVPIEERWEYALRGVNGELFGTGLEVGTINPGEAGLTQGITPSLKFLNRHSIK